MSLEFMTPETTERISQRDKAMRDEMKKESAFINDMRREERSGSTVDRESKERNHLNKEFERLYDSSDMVCHINSQGFFQRLNPAWTETLGWTREELTSKSLIEFIHPDDRRATSEAADKARGQEATVSFKNRFRCSDGSYKWILWKSFPMPDEDLVFAIAHHLSDREPESETLQKTHKEPEAASRNQSPTKDRVDQDLIINEDLFRLMVESFKNYAIILLDAEGRIVTWNSGAERIIGYRADEIIGEYFSRFYPTEDIQRGKHVRALQSAIADGRFEYEGWRLRKNGTRFWANVAITALRDESGTLRGFAKVTHDMTERKKTEEKLRGSEERYRRLFEESLTGNFISTPNGRILACNPAYAHIFGFSSVEEALKCNTSDLYHSPERHQAFIKQLYERRKLEHVEVQMRRRDGETIYIIENALGRFNDEGELVEIQGYLIDNTEQKILEQRLIQMQKMECIGTLAGGIAHDFNNILGIILAYSSTLERGVPNPQKLAHTLDCINKAIERGAGLARQILTFARKNELTLEPININATIHGLSKMLHETFPKKIEIILELDELVPIVTMDHTQLHQALLNLCVNARDAMTEPGPKASTRCILKMRTKIVEQEEMTRRFPDARQSQYICIEVADTGVGMEESTRQRIFEPFFTTKEKGKGTGLGLAVVYGVVKNHDGLIDVESQRAHGTTFRLYFPIPAEVTSTTRIQGDRMMEVAGGTETILFAEDEDGLAMLMKTLFESKGYSVILAKNGVEAIQLYAENKSDISVAFLDVGLPKLDGTTVFTTVREINPRQKVILASGYMDPDQKSELFKAGLSDFVQKPYMPNEVLRKIRDVLDLNT
jgi:two-component system cell cycle sensor histidine kinase/response regulator CckA